ncbi:hypothetical protein [Chromobacterium violaceum]|nr:hypothetical protein [Chromobacterium violaceum]QRO33935.1 hypothetical protein I6K04_04120 [Chromobacterium violaceum]QRQ16261.1 hypothetical protein I6K03_18610 [Chromobacterium violaceum]
MIDIDAIIDSMGWSPDTDERADMRRLCQATLAAAAEQSGEAVAESMARETEQRGRVARLGMLADRLSDAAQPAPAVPDLWRLMLQRLVDECERADKQALDEVRCGFIHGHIVAEARAMLAAAPSPN